MVDRDALVHSLDPKMATERIRTFQGNTEKVILPAIMREFITLMSHLICTLEIDLIKVQITAQLRVGLEHILALLQGVLFEKLQK